MEIFLDVSALEPCEPLERTLAALSTISMGSYLHVLHRRRPQLLFPLLDKQGFAWHCVEGGEDFIDLYIWRGADQDAHMQVIGVIENLQS